MRDAHDLNVIGAFAVATADRLFDAADAGFRPAGASAAALAALAQVEQGRTVNSLARSLRVSHSRAVRVADALVAEGLARRVPSEADGRAVQVRLTARGVRAAARIQAARADALEQVLAGLSPAEVAALAEVASKVLTATTRGRAHAQSICRLCDAVVCGHLDGRCPVTAGADAAERGGP